MSESYEATIQEVIDEGRFCELDQSRIEEALSFVLTLHNMFKENGVEMPENPDVNLLENLIDGIHGELAAACLFLAERSFKNVPSMLRDVAKGFDALDTAFKDPTGQEKPSVPVVIRKGFLRLADRIEATRVQQAYMQRELKKFTD